MITAERNVQKMSWPELLLSIDNLCVVSRDEQALSEKMPIPASWQRLVRGNRIIVFYAGTGFQSKYCGSPGEQAQQYVDLINTLGASLGNMKGAVLWWFDDGSLRSLMDAVADEKERLKLERSYMWTLQMHLAKAVHDESGDFSRALSWGSIYFGEASAYGAEYQKAHKPVITYTLTGNTQSLENWLADSFKEESWPILPDKWETCIRDRKVLLFCMQPQTLLMAGALAATLLENLIYLAQERQDICVWWLVDTELDKAASLLSEELRLAFEASRKKFQEAANVIYDISGEAKRALEYADVCFGSLRGVGGHSAVRPVVAPPYCLKVFPECPQIGAFCRERQKIYFTYNVRTVFGVLCEADLLTDKVRVLCQVPNNEELTDWGLDYLLTVKTEQKLIMPPFFTDTAFLEYDLATERLQSVPCEKKVWAPNLERYGAFGPIAKFHDSLYFIGNANGLLVEYRKTDGCYIYHEHWLDSLGLKQNPIFGDAQLINDIWYLVPTNMPILLALDMQSMTADIVQLPLPEGFQPRAISRCGEELWLSPLQGNSLACIHMDSKQMEIIKCPTISKNQRFPFSSVVPWQQGRLIFPYFAAEVHLWQPGNQEAEPRPELTRKLVRPFEDTDTRNEVFWAKQGESGDSYLSFRERGTELIEFWPESGEARYHKLKLEPEDKRMLERLVHAWNLRNLLKPLTDEIEKTSWRLYNTTGQRIWQSISKCSAI